MGWSTLKYTLEEAWGLLNLPGLPDLEYLKSGYTHDYGQIPELYDSFNFEYPGNGRSLSPTMARSTSGATEAKQRNCEDGTTRRWQMLRLGWLTRTGERSQRWQRRGSWHCWQSS